MFRRSIAPSLSAPTRPVHRTGTTLRVERTQSGSALRACDAGRTRVARALGGGAVEQAERVREDFVDGDLLQALIVLARAAAVIQRAEARAAGEIREQMH